MSAETHVPSVTVDPECSEELAQFIRLHANWGNVFDLAEDPYRPIPWSPLRSGLLLVAVGGATAAAAWSAYALGTSSGGRAQDYLSWVTACGLGVAALAGAVATGFSIRRLIRALPGRRLFLQAQGRFVPPTALTEDDKRLLARAQVAVESVRSSAVHRQDLLDRQRNDVFLPHETWAVATALAEHSRLSRSGATAADLREARAGIESRVGALETYARHTTQADALYLRWQADQARHTDRTAVEALLAQTAAHRLATQDTTALVSQADALAAALRNQLPGGSGPEPQITKK
ncbi:hypothetical protein ACODT4_44410 [Streptomyces sp. 2.9]|uniref:hypothetical protein n=1 Tax=Streptomyces tritrimontium TaxID=3406573 RepID=UPI003BB6A372